MLKLFNEKSLRIDDEHPLIWKTKLTFFLQLPSHQIGFVIELNIMEMNPLQLSNIIVWLVEELTNEYLD